MFKLSKKLNICLIIACLISYFYYSILTLINLNTDTIIFKYLKSVFVCVILGVIFFDYYLVTKNYNKIEILRYIITSILFFTTLFLSLTILKLINFGFYDGKEFYWQLASLVIGVISIASLIIILKKRLQIQELNKSK